MGHAESNSVRFNSYDDEDHPKLLMEERSAPLRTRTIEPTPHANVEWLKMINYSLHILNIEFV